MGEFTATSCRSLLGKEILPSYTSAARSTDPDTTRVATKLLQINDSAAQTAPALTCGATQGTGIAATAYRNGRRATDCPGGVDTKNE
ncbi:hypothetical protein GCM10022265_09340 [Marinobacter xestospongiae]